MNDTEEIVRLLIAKTQAERLHWRRLEMPPELPESGQWVYSSAVKLPNGRAALVTFRYPTTKTVRPVDEPRLEMKLQIMTSTSESLLPISYEDAEALRTAIEAHPESLAGDVAEALKSL